MTGKAARTIRMVAVVFAGMFPWILAGAQDSGADSLESQLAAKYKLVKLGTDSTGLSVLEAGRAGDKERWHHQRPSGNAVILPSTVKDGQVHAASNTAAQGVSKFLNGRACQTPRARRRRTRSS